MILNDEQMKEQVRLNCQLKKQIESLTTTIQDIYKNFNNGDNFEWRNTKMIYWQDICGKYNEDKLLNAYGDIFFIEERDISSEGERYVGRRILWNLGLSNEKYEIFGERVYDSDGDYEGMDYEVRVLV